ncbi:MAG: hypothetical protein R2789_17430 [Microthrixaceae bacterium]
MSNLDGTRRSIILSETVNGLTPVLLLFSVFLTFRGHNAGRRVRRRTGDGRRDPPPLPGFWTGGDPIAAHRSRSC